MAYGLAMTLFLIW